MIRLFRRRPRTALEAENADLKRQLLVAGILVWYFRSTRRPEVCPRCGPKHRWRTRIAHQDQPTLLTGRHSR